MVSENGIATSNLNLLGLQMRIQELEDENASLRKEYSENTVVQSMNDMKDQYNELEYQYNQIDKALGELEIIVAQSVSRNVYNDLLEMLDSERKNKDAIVTVLNKLKEKIQIDTGISLTLRYEYKILLNFIKSLC